MHPDASAARKFSGQDGRRRRTEEEYLAYGCDGDTRGAGTVTILGCISTSWRTAGRMFLIQKAARVERGPLRSIEGPAAPSAALASVYPVVRRGVQAPRRRDVSSSSRSPR